MKIDLDFIKETFFFNEISSTNDAALANDFKDEFTLFIAETQFKGRGRNQREWYSPSGKNLYFSFLLKPNVEKKFYTSLPLYSAYSVYETLNRYLTGVKINIKWPNDILVDNKKISGILIEVSEDAVVIGVGINVNAKKFPEFNMNTPTSLSLETGREYCRKKVLKEFFFNFKKNYDIFLKENRLSNEILENINKVLYLKDNEVVVVFKNSETKKGKILSVTSEGFLKLDKFTAVAGDVLKVKI